MHNRCLTDKSVDCTTMIINEVEVSDDDSPSAYRKNSVAEIIDHDVFLELTKHQRRTVTVEPLVIFYVIVLYLQQSVLSQYIYYRVGVDYNITTNSNLAFVCNNQDNSTAEKEKTDRLQDINTSYMMYISLVSAVCTIVTAPFYSVFSDRFGRKSMYFLPGIGSVLKSLFEVLIISLKWPIGAFILTEGLYGLFGGYPFAVGLSYSYIADISTSKTRTRRLAIIVALMGLGALSVSLVSGYWIKYSGYLVPYAFSGCFAVLCLVYPLVYLKEPPRMESKTKNRLPPMKQLKTLVTIYTDRPREQTTVLVIVVAMFGFYYVAEMATFAIIGTYLMSFPICMTTIEMSYFSFINLAAINFGIAISVIGFAKCLPDLFIVLICHLSGMLFSLQMAFANGATATYIAAASNLLSFSAFQFIRGFLSKQVGPNEQGALFGGLMLWEIVGGAITKVVMVFFYKKTFHIFHGMVYLFIGSFSVVALILTVLTAILERRSKYQMGFSKMK